MRTCTWEEENASERADPSLKDPSRMHARKTRRKFRIVIIAVKNIWDIRQDKTRIRQRDNYVSYVTKETIETNRRACKIETDAHVVRKKYAIHIYLSKDDSEEESLR